MNSMWPDSTFRQSLAVEDENENEINPHRPIESNRIDSQNEGTPDSLVPLT